MVVKITAVLPEPYNVPYSVAPSSVVNVTVGVPAGGVKLESGVSESRAVRVGTGEGGLSSVEAREGVGASVAGGGGGISVSVSAAAGSGEAGEGDGEAVTGLQPANSQARVSRAKRYRRGSRIKGIPPFLPAFFRVNPRPVSLRQ
jgi:hypothetical protein